MHLMLLALVGMSPGVAAQAGVTKGALSFIHDDLNLTRYEAAAVDLNDDGVPEMLVYADAPPDCGSGGCDLYIIAKSGGGYRIVTTISVVRLPIRLLTTSANGWHDLGVEVGGGGIRRGYEARLKFDGKTYPGNPTVAPALPLPSPTGRVVLP